MNRRWPIWTSIHSITAHGEHTCQRDSVNSSPWDYSVPCSRTSLLNATHIAPPPTTGHRPRTHSVANDYPSRHRTDALYGMHSGSESLARNWTSRCREEINYKNILINHLLRQDGISYNKKVVQGAIKTILVRIMYTLSQKSRSGIITDL